MTYGLLAALGWGVSTLAAAMAARRIGSFLTVVAGETTALVAYALVFFIGPFSLRGAGGAAWFLFPAGVIGVIGYLALYRGLESGHVGLVSAISACYAGVTVLLSVALLGEHLSALATVGIAATLAGVTLAVARGTTTAPAPVPARDRDRASCPGSLPDPGSAPGPGSAPAPARDRDRASCPGSLPDPGSAPGPGSAPRPGPAPGSAPAPCSGHGDFGRNPDPGPGPAATAAHQANPATGAVYGIIAALCYGVGGFLIGRYTRPLGWLVPVVVARTGAMIVLLALLATPLRRPADGASNRFAHGLAWAAAAGLTDAAGLTFFARGDQVGLVSITAAVSSAYPIIPLVGGLLLFRERLLMRQVGGTALILAGLVMLGVGS